MRTHSRLAAAAIELLKQTSPQYYALLPPDAVICDEEHHNVLTGPRCAVERVTCIPQAVIDEDECVQAGEDETVAPFTRHFYNPKTGKGLPGFDRAPIRAAEFWDQAVLAYLRGDRLEAFDRLGHAMHLLQDMTSPAHVHNDPHVTVGGCVDADDFENWGYCLEGGDGDTLFDKVLQYADHGPAFGNVTIESRLQDGINKIFSGQPQILTPGPNDSNLAEGFVHRLANKVYNFTTFQVTLRDTSSLSRDDGRGELERMFPSLEESLTKTGWSIDRIGFSFGDCVGTDVSKTGQWWIMPGQCVDSNACQSLTDPFCHTNKGQAYIENSGGGGTSAGNDEIPNNVYPRQYDKTWFRRLRGSKDNTGSSKRAMLWIYGDVLYPAAVVHSAGLIKAFLDEVAAPPVADAGGHYDGETCSPVTFDASGSQDVSGQDLLYEWDFDADGIVDSADLMPLVDHTYLSEYSGLAFLRVTNTLGLSSEDTATVEIAPDQTPPQVDMLTASPRKLWPITWRMTPVDLSVSVADDCPARCRITRVEVNDPWRKRPARFTNWDVQITGDLKVRLRSRGYWRGDGRVYTIEVECVDASGNATVRTVDVPVSP